MTKLKRPLCDAWGPVIDRIANTAPKPCYICGRIQTDAPTFKIHLVREKTWLPICWDCLHGEGKDHIFDGAVHAYFLFKNS